MKPAPALFLFPPDASARETGDLSGAAAEAGLAVTRVGTTEELLAALAKDEGWKLVLVSLQVDQVDRAFLARLRGAVAEGARVAVSAPGITLDRAILAREAGGGPLVHEPLDRGALLRFREPDPGPRGGLPLPPVLPAAAGASSGPALVGASPALASILETVAEAGDSAAPVLVEGEPGTGKELVARALHDAGSRRSGPFVSVNCGALPEQSLEVELFGQARGAGAEVRRVGRLERARGGTLFLAEVSELPPILQSRLLQVLREGNFEPVGESRSIPVEFRLVAGAPGGLAAKVRAGGFLEELFQWISAIHLEIPPLRERTEDVIPLAFHYVRFFATRYRRTMEGLTEDAARLLQAHPWPGNTRELRNALDGAVLRNRGGWIGAEDLALEEGSPELTGRGAAPAGYPPTRSLGDVERDHIRKVLRHTGGVMGDAARILGIHRNTLTRKVDRYGLRDDVEPGDRGGGLPA
jgi:DNA-binding NtrC family response regulator